MNRHFRQPPPPSSLQDPILRYFPILELCHRLPLLGHNRLFPILWPLEKWWLFCHAFQQLLLTNEAALIRPTFQLDVQSAETVF